jgi:hypothetical protein
MGVVSRPRRLLDDKFEGNELRFQSFVRSDCECRRAMLQSAGFDVVDAAVVGFKPQYYGSPDFVCRLADDRAAIIELCFELTARHAFRDFSYLLDPAAAKLAGIVWVTDSVSPSVVNMIRHYAHQFGLARRVTLEILLPQRFDADAPVRFAFDRCLGDLRAGTARRTDSGVTVLERLLDLHRTLDEIDTPALARVLGVTSTWITFHASKARNGRAPRLVCTKAPGGGPLRGDDGRFYFDLERVHSFVADFERLVAQLEARSLRGAAIPLVSARDPRIGIQWATLEAFRREAVTRSYSVVKNALGAPAAFHISSSGRGYSLLWPIERRSALRLRAA